jgi:hypothetical protein
MKFLAQGLKWPLHATVFENLIKSDTTQQLKLGSEKQYLSVTGFSFSAWIH